MNAYQTIMNNLSLSEAAKLRISRSIQSEWDKERAQNSFPRTLKIGVSIAMASIVAILSVAIPFGIKDANDEHSRLAISIIGIDTLYSDDNGTFCWREMAYAKTIFTGDTLYESSRAGFLIVKAEFDFASYSLREFGIMLHEGGPEFPQKNDQFMRYYIYCINYYKNEEGTHECKVKENGDLNLDITKAISTDLHIFEDPGEVHGTAFLCVEVDDFVYDYLSYMHDMEVAGGEIQGVVQIPDYQDIILTLNNIWSPNKFPGVRTITRIGCSFAEVNFYNSYEI